jgi:hypothetical protein
MRKEIFLPCIIYSLSFLSKLEISIMIVKYLKLTNTKRANVKERILKIDQNRIHNRFIVRIIFGDLESRKK